MIMLFGNLKSPLIKERVKILKEISNDEVTLVNDISKEKFKTFHGLEVYNQFYSKFRFINYVINSLYTMFLIIIKKPEIIIVHWASRILQGLVISLWGKKVIVHTMGGDIDENQDAKGYKKIFTSILLRKARIITVKSHEMREMIFKNFPEVEKDKIKILTWGVSDEFIKKGEQINKAEIPTFFCFRACQPLYEKEIILESFSKLLYEHNVKSRLIVSIHRKNEYYYNILLKLADELNISCFIDWVDVKHEDMPLFIKKSWGVISAYQHDGFSQSLMESWSLGTWPVYRVSNAHIRYLRDYENCLVYENSDELTEKMLWIIDNKEKKPIVSSDIHMIIDYNYQSKIYRNLLESIRDSQI